MLNRNLKIAIGIALALGATQLKGADPKTPSKYRLDSLRGLEIKNIQGEVAEYRGRRAVRLIKGKDQGVETNSDAESLAIVSGTDFKDGTIEAEIAGTPAPGAPADSRGFIGIAFRVKDQGQKFECFYLRPTNGRAEDQLRRNHSLQYESIPDYPWHRLRKENPGVYESYADIEAGAWTKIRIEVAGAKARLFVNGSAQPALVVNDLKLGDGHGPIALWSTVETDGHFSNLTVR
ncbi:MAG: hypothetical protein ACRD59_04725 [Candidatus Acidiferrales bacterium]